jgi:hypothetical protein
VQTQGESTRGRRRTFTDSQERSILELHHAHVPYPKIAAQVRLPVTTIEGIIQRRGMTKKQRPISALTLQSLYVDKRLSIANVAKSLGLPKTNVERWLRRHGIARRPLRIYRRVPFSGDSREKAYLVGFRYGDLHVSRRGLGLVVSTTTTHPSMLVLFTTCFEKYGHVSFSPAYNRKTGSYQWSVRVILDLSFSFLLKKPEKLPRWITKSCFAFRSFLAGFIDAEGSIGVTFPKSYHRPKSPWPYISVSNGNLSLISEIRHLTTRYHPRLRLNHKAGTPTSRNGTIRRTDNWVLIFSRQSAVKELLVTLPIHHMEKVAKAAIVLNLIRGDEAKGLEARYARLKREISSGVEELTRLAAKKIAGR